MACDKKYLEHLMLPYKNYDQTAARFKKKKKSCFPYVAEHIATEHAVENGNIIILIASCSKALHLEVKEENVELIVEHAKI